MTRIKINPDLTRQNSAAFSRAASDLVNMHWDINRLAGQLDWEVRSRGGVESKISSAASQGKQLYEEAERLADYLKKCAAGLEEADCQGQQSLSAASVAYVSPATVLGTVAAGGLLAGLIAGGKNVAITKLTWIKNCIWPQSRRVAFEELIEKNSVGKRLADFNSNHYDGGIKFPRYSRNFNYEGQCTWYCFGRTQEKLGKVIEFKGGEGTGMAMNWLNPGNIKNCAISNNPLDIKPNCIAVSKYPPQTGHVIFIENVENGYVFFSEANSTGDNVIDPQDGVIQTLSIDSFIRNKQISGYVDPNVVTVLDVPEF